MEKDNNHRIEHVKTLWVHVKKTIDGRCDINFDGFLAGFEEHPCETIRA